MLILNIHTKSINRIKYNKITYKYSQLYGKLVAMEEGLKISEFSIKMTLYLPINDMTLHGHHSSKFVFQSQKPAPRSSKHFLDRLQH